MTLEEFDRAKVGDRLYTEYNKYVIVYRNKTKLYLKVAGTDVLDSLSRDYTYGLKSYELTHRDIDSSEREILYQKTHLQRELRTARSQYDTNRINIQYIQDHIKRYQDQLREYESVTETLRNKYEAKKKEYEEFCKTHGIEE